MWKVGYGLTLSRPYSLGFNVPSNFSTKAHIDQSHITPANRVTKKKPPPYFTCCLDLKALFFTFQCSGRV